MIRKCSCGGKLKRIGRVSIIGGIRTLRDTITINGIEAEKQKGLTLFECWKCRRKWA